MSKKKSGKIRKLKEDRKVDFRNDREIAMDFSVKVYKKFDKMIKAIVLFGSSAKNTATSNSDIDLVIIIDDATIQWDQELIAWYREELGKLAKSHNYIKELHLTTVKITTWWNDLMKGDPTVINMLRYGEALVDVGGFFNPIKHLLINGRIKPTPEAIYTALERAPEHFRRSKIAELSAIEGLFWAMVDSSQAALMSHGALPPSPENIAIMLKEVFVDNKKLKLDYVSWYRDLYIFHKKISHGEITEIKGNDIDVWQKRTEEFMKVMIQLVRETL